MRYQEILLESKTSKLKSIARDITAGKVPTDVLHKLKSFMNKLLGVDTCEDDDKTPESNRDLNDLLGVKNTKEASEDELAHEEDNEESEGLDDEFDPDEDDYEDIGDLDDEDDMFGLQESENKLMDKYLKTVKKTEKVGTASKNIGPEDLNIYEQLKRANPADAEIIWSFYNRSMIESVVEDLFREKDLSNADAERFNNLIIRNQGKLEDKVAFVQRIKDAGIIDLRKVITPGKGSVDKLFNYKSEILDNIKHELLDFKVSPKSTAVNVGAGEGFFMILGKNISKRGAGDLNVLGREVEVKAQGARLKGFGGKGSYGDGAFYYKKFNAELVKILGSKGVLYFKEQYGFNPNMPWHFSLAKLQALSDVLAKSKANQAEVKSLFDKLLAYIFSRSTPEMRKQVTNVIGRNGSFDVDEFRKAWFLLTYDYYKFTSTNATGETFAGILFINQPSFSYCFITTSSQLEKEWSNFQLNPNLYNWTDPQSVAPKISFLKEIRAKRSKKRKSKAKLPAKAN